MPSLLYVHIWAIKQKDIYENVQSHPGIYSPLIHSIVSADFVSGQRWRTLGRALAVRACFESIFLLGVTHIIVEYIV